MIDSSDIISRETLYQIKQVIYQTPLLVIPFLIYNALAFTRPLEQLVPAHPQDYWSAGSIISLSALLVLIIEIYKSTRTGHASLFDLLGSGLLLIITILEFILVERVRSVCLLSLIAVMLVDVVGGWIITHRSSRDVMAHEGRG